MDCELPAVPSPFIVLGDVDFAGVAGSPCGGMLGPLTGGADFSAETSTQVKGKQINRRPKGTSVQGHGTRGRQWEDSAQLSPVTLPPDPAGPSDLLGFSGLS